MTIKQGGIKDAKSEVTSAASAIGWPIFKVDDLTKARYAKKRTAAIANQ